MKLHGVWFVFVARIRVKIHVIVFGKTNGFEHDENECTFDPPSGDSEPLT